MEVGKKIECTLKTKDQNGKTVFVKGMTVSKDIHVHVYMYVKCTCKKNILLTTTTQQYHIIQLIMDKKMNNKTR